MRSASRFGLPIRSFPTWTVVGRPSPTSSICRCVEEPGPEIYVPFHARKAVAVDVDHACGGCGHRRDPGSMTGAIRSADPPRSIPALPDGPARGGHSRPSWTRRDWRSRRFSDAAGRRPLAPLGAALLAVPWVSTGAVRVFGDQAGTQGKSASALAPRRARARRVFVPGC